jgi:hypothetical protein
MRSFVAVIVAVVLAAIAAIPAAAMPVDKGARPVAHAQHAAPVAPASDDGTPAFVYALIGGGALLAFGAGGYMGGRSVVARQAQARPS